MPRPALSFQIVAPVLAAVFAIAAIVLVLTSRPHVPPPLSRLTVLEGTVRDRTSGFTGPTLRVVTGRTERTINARACASGVSELRPGDTVTAWLDPQGRAWRLMRGPKALCTYLQAVATDEASRRTKRLTALLLALAGVVCAALAVRGRFRRG